jgi:gluconolactonase
MDMAEAFAPGVADGFLFRVPADGRPAELMADGIEFANGLAFDADESHIYVCQTTGMNVVRYAIDGDGSLGPKETYGPVLGVRPPADAPRPLPPDVRTQVGFTDGCGFDVDGNLWVTLFVGNRIVAITPSGEVETVLSDPAGELLRAPTNVSWGGEDMRDLYIGSIQADYILHAPSPVPGLRLYHQR